MSANAYPPEIVAAMGGRPPVDEQWNAISMPLEPCVVVAGAGSGKTSVMAARVVYLALVALGRIEAEHEGVLPGNVLCLTFTNKATENLALRVRSALSALELPEGEEPEVLNYHGFAAQILERHGLLAGIEPGRQVLTPAQRSELCADVLDRAAFEHVKVEWQPTVISGILELADQAANHRVTPERIVEHNLAMLDTLKKAKSQDPYRAGLQRIELARAVGVFRDLKRELGVIDFGDQIELALDVVERFPEVAEDYRRRFRAVLLDEFQDTNVAQAQLMRLVFGGGFPVTAVGDPDQNIYAWRGASLFNLLEFPRQFPGAEGGQARKLPLFTNFRSGARILAAADTIIDPLPAAQRPDPDKRLEPWPDNGEGEVTLVRHSDEWSEASWIAGKVAELHDAGSPWSEVAVLSRKTRLFVSLQEAFRERHIPVEFVGLAGLLSLPEVVEVLSYARAVADPEASVAIARILLGPRYRVGFKDLARVAAWAKERNYALRRTDDEDEATAFVVAEALEHLDEVEGLSDEGRARLQEFRAELAELRVEARRPVGEFLAQVIRRIGLLDELDAGLDVETVAAARRNLAAFLDEVHAFSPVQGQLTLHAFLDYVTIVEQAEKPEWSPVQPSAEDSVKVMTIHQAKGLEFDVVFVPGLAEGLLPDLKIQQNPAERGKSLDFELRGDKEILPRFDGTMSRMRSDLKRQEEYEERRTCYVALTRARRRLFVSGAHWYGDAGSPKKPSAFLEELFDWGESTGRASVDRGPELDDEAGNPLVGYRQRFVRDWPGPAWPAVEADGLFPEGWRRVDTETEPAALAAGLPQEERSAFEQASREHRTMAATLLERESEPPAAPRAPSGVSVGGVIEYLACPKRFYWTSVRPLPRFSGPAARIGTRIHRWIELQARGQTSLLEEEDQPDLTTEELAGEPGKISRLQQTFLESRFSGVAPLYAERPFLLQVEGFTISGRIDAVYGTSDGPWEVVDYKTGQIPPEDDPLARAQLDLYALACVDVFGKRSEQLTLTYLYLAHEREVRYAVDDIEEVRARVVEALRGIVEQRFDPAPGRRCANCDFLPFCEAGGTFVESQAGSG